MLYTPLLSFSSFLGVIVVISTLLLLYPCFSVGVFLYIFPTKGSRTAINGDGYFSRGQRGGKRNGVLALIVYRPFFCWISVLFFFGFTSIY